MPVAGRCGRLWRLGILGRDGEGNHVDFAAGDRDDQRRSGAVWHLWKALSSMNTALGIGGQGVLKLHKKTTEEWAKRGFDT